jgi:hypothetical protein
MATACFGYHLPVVACWCVRMSYHLCITVQVFAKVIALAGVAVVSRFFFKFEPSLLLLGSALLITVSTLLYYIEPQPRSTPGTQHDKPKAL